MNNKSKMTVNEAETAIEKLKAKRTIALGDIETAKVKLGELTLKALTSPSNEIKRALESCGIDLRSAQSDVEGLTRALDTTLELKKETQAYLDAMNEEVEWKKIRKICQRRADITSEIEREIESLTNKIKELLQLSADLYFLAPRKDSGAMGFLSSDALMSFVRYTFQKYGLPGEARWPWGIPSIPTLLPAVLEGNGLILRNQPHPPDETAEESV